ncbi:MAG TPA: ParB N-terminal domain-containing protein [Spirochaetota bacterium]|nr:ParB N-terminal domain-containing protein [Spirochaetota bacterium]HNU90367.1 ParB N-terminal domain-containing protein [Spirochaetota bacterium]HPV96287.1 ParB N-terminal domain-containing protein [Spirochaetota bacterium]
MKISIDKIKVKRRMRSDLGNMHDLRESMRKHGLISPITLTQNHELLAGYRRLQAAKELGWREIDCHLINARTRLAKFEIETEENILRKAFTADEMERVAASREELSARGLKRLWFLLRRCFKALRALFSRGS